MLMELDDYQEEAEETAVFPYELPEFLNTGQVYVVLGCAGETGEIEEKLKKAVREEDEKYITEMRYEVGDVLWYLSQICEEFDWSLEQIAEENLAKLQDREERGQLTGRGDNR
jgi:NTP pyrophosphatase (non-canonical NTP hydrolase)